MPTPQVSSYLTDLLANLPPDWLALTTHRLDIYDEQRAKSQFVEGLEALANAGNASRAALAELPTAYDYVRLGHPLSCVLEWALARRYGLSSANVISFSSRVAPVLAVLRKNLLDGIATRILYRGTLPPYFAAEQLRRVYGYSFDLVAADDPSVAGSGFAGSTVLLVADERLAASPLPAGVDFLVATYGHLGSVLFASPANSDYIADIQHVRRRETIAMTPANCLTALTSLLNETPVGNPPAGVAANRDQVRAAISQITATTTTPLVGSSGLSVQYAIMMGLIDHANHHHPGKAIKFVVPPNCYGGTNDQARRVAACLGHVQIVDLPVDGDNDMVQSTDAVLRQIAHQDAVPYIIAEIPTNPRVEVPDLDALKRVLSAPRTTATGAPAIPPVFILDQTFCPNVNFLGRGQALSTVRTLAYASGSKFPSGGRCTAGYCVANDLAATLMETVGRHLQLCDNEATAQQYEILAEQLPSMNDRIRAAYANTRAFVDFIGQTLPSANVNFVSPELAAQGFTPSVFSLDLPTKGNSPAEREAYKRKLNHQLIQLMITRIPRQSKYCVSYGQLKGCYWTIPATSTQGTTKEGDKDYIVRVSLSPALDLELHKTVFREFVAGI